MSLKTDYVDALFSGSRKYRVIENEDGTVSFEDVTEYTQAGDSFGAKDVNETNAAVISLQNEQIETVDPMVTTEAGFAADAAATREAIEEVSANLSKTDSSLSTLKNSLGTQATLSLSGTTLTITTK